MLLLFLEMFYKLESVETHIKNHNKRNKDERTASQQERVSRISNSTANEA